jgi:uncharacterized repeat protein (TIGR01451 family)
LCQSQGIVWQKPIGGSSSESADILIHSRDSTFLMITSSFSTNGEVGGNYGATDIWVVNYNRSGTILWTRRLGSSSFEFPYDAFQKNNGQYIIGGQAGSGNNFDVSGNHGFTDMWVINLAENGNTRWAKCFGGSSFDDLKRIIPTDDGGYIIVGSTQSTDFDATGNHGLYDLLTIKIDSLGGIQWRNILGGDNDDRVIDATKAADGSIYMVAKTYSNNTGNITNYKGDGDIWVVKLNSSGVLQWQKTLGGSSDESPVRLRITNDNNLLILSTSSSNDGDVTGNHGSSDLWLTKLNTTGNIIWQKSFGGTNGEIADQIIEESDGSLVLLGAAYSNNGNLTGNFGRTDIWVVKTTVDGNLQWQKNYGGSGWDGSVQVQKKLNHTGYYIIGYTDSHNDGNVFGFHMPQNPADTLIHDGWFLDLDASGNLITQRCFGGSRRDFIYQFIQISESELMFAGQTSSFDGDVIGGYNTTSNPGGDSWLILYGAVNRIKGAIFYDNNQNGVKDPGEFLVNGIRVNSNRPNYERSTFTNNGLFVNEVDTGIFTTRVQLTSPYFTTAPLQKTTSFASFNNTDSFSFALQGAVGQRDLTISAIPLSVARPGIGLTYKLFYKNIGTDTVTNGVIFFKKDPRFNFIFAAPAVSSTSGDTLKWNYSNFKPFDSASILISMQVQPPPMVNFNDTLSSVAIITPVANDLTPSDDTSFVKQIVVGPHDPNDKSENLAGKITLQQIANSSYINYLIRFQNTGTDTAFNITVRDTLDTKLDWNSLQMIGASHSYQVQIISQNKIAWGFNNIQLPDSNRNEPRSHGFIAYRIKPKNNLVVGDTIKNSASIYFDFNMPIQTNKQATVVSNNIVTGINNIQNRSEAMLISPNPADNEIWIRIKERVYGSATITVTEISGRRVYQEDLGRVDLSNFNKKINLKNIAPGTYIVGVFTNEKFYVQKLIVQ